MKRGFRHGVFTALSGILWVCLITFLLWNTGELARLYPAVSLRYHTPLSGQQAGDARGYAAESGAFWPTFWTETEEEVQGGLQSAPGKCLWFSGEGALAYPADFVAGGYPGALDQNGIAISTGLAWRLWGSVDVMGLEASVLEGRYLVRGVFDSPAPLVLIGCGEGTPVTGWNGVELSGAKGISEEEAILYAQSAGLGEPDTVVDHALVTLCGLLAGFPFALAAGRGIWILLGWLWQALPRYREVALVIACLLGAVLLPFALEQVPAALVPNRWSDFDFWLRLGLQGQEKLHAFLLLRPYSVDLQGKLLLLKQCAAFALAMPISTFLCRNIWRRQEKRRDKAAVFAPK